MSTPTTHPPRGPLPTEHLQARLAAYDAAVAAVAAAKATEREARRARDKVIGDLFYDDGLTIRDIEQLTGMPHATIKYIAAEDPRRTPAAIGAHRRRRPPRIPAGMPLRKPAA